MKVTCCTVTMTASKHAADSVILLLYYRVQLPHRLWPPLSLLEPCTNQQPAHPAALQGSRHRGSSGSSAAACIGHPDAQKLLGNRMCRLLTVLLQKQFLKKQQQQMLGGDPMQDSWLPLPRLRSLTAMCWRGRIELQRL